MTSVRIMSTDAGIEEGRDGMTVADAMRTPEMAETNGSALRGRRNCGPILPTPLRGGSFVVGRPEYSHGDFTAFMVASSSGLMKSATEAERVGGRGKNLLARDADFSSTSLSVSR